jgi:hypothetical protein
VLLVLLAVLLNWRRSTRLTQSAAIGAALILFVAWAVGDWHWLMAPVVTAMAYTAVCRRTRDGSQRHTIHAIAGIGGLGLFWLALSQVIGTVNTIYAYGVGYGVNLGMILLAHFAESRRGNPIAWAVIKSAHLSFVALAAPYLALWWHNPNALRLAGFAFLTLNATIAAFAWWQPSLRDCPADTGRWVRQGVLSAVASAIAFGIISLLEPWSTSFE